MADQRPPPRKQPRLFDSSKKQITNLLNRRRTKNQKEGGRNDDSRRQDEDEESFRSKIPYLSKSGQSQISLTTFSSVSSDGSVKPSISSSSKTTLSIPDLVIDDGRRDGDDDMPEAFSTTKQQRRRGITNLIQLHDTKNEFQRFAAGAGVVPVVTPQTDQLNRAFTFTTTDNSHRVPPSDKLLTDLQLEQAGRNAFTPQQEESELLQDENFISGQIGVNIEHIPTIKHFQQLSQTQLPQAPSPLAHLQTPLLPRDLNEIHPQLQHLQLANTQIPKIVISKPDVEDINTTSTYLPEPTFEFPATLSSNELYRNASHRSSYCPPENFCTSIPDVRESKNFVHDVEATCQSTSSKPTHEAIYGRSRDASTKSKIRVPTGSKPIDKKDFDTSISIAGIGISNLPLHASACPRVPDSQTPENAYTTPGRLVSAYLASKQHMRHLQNLKRKRPTVKTYASFHHAAGSTSASAEDLQIETHPRPPFTGIFNSLLLYPDLLLTFCQFVPSTQLLSLYSISKDFHVIANQRLTTLILNQAALKTPLAVKAYPYRSYTYLTRPDPSLRASEASLIGSGISYQNEGIGTSIPKPPSKSWQKIKTLANIQACNSATPTIRLTARVPTFRYLQFLLVRTKSLHTILSCFAERGVPLPWSSGFMLSMHKLWFLFDIPDNPRRIAYIHSTSLMTNQDLLHILLFIVKLDMVLNAPLAGEKRDGIRKLIMSSCDGLTTLRKVLTREIWRNDLDVLRAWTRYGLQLGEDGSERTMGGSWVPLGLTPEQHRASPSVFGVPRNEIGVWKKEFWGRLEKLEKSVVEDVAEVDQVTGEVKVKRVVRTVKVEAGALGRKPSWLIRPDQCVLRESVKRGQMFGKWFFRCLVHGYFDVKGLERKMLRDNGGRRDRVLEGMGEYQDVGDLYGGVAAMSVQDEEAEERDDGMVEVFEKGMLDLGKGWAGSPYTSVRPGIGRVEKEIRRRNEKTGENVMQAWRREIEQERSARQMRGYQILE